MVKSAQGSQESIYYNGNEPMVLAKYTRILEEKIFTANLSFLEQY